MRTVWHTRLAAGLLLVAAGAQEAEERANVRRIYDRIQLRVRKPAGSSTGAYKVTIPNTTVSYDMVSIPAGEFTMGSPARKDEQPPHKVRLDAFWMQAHEVTWDEYRLFMFASMSDKQDGGTAQKDETVD